MLPARAHAQLGTAASCRQRPPVVPQRSSCGGGRSSRARSSRAGGWAAVRAAPRRRLCCPRAVADAASASGSDGWRRVVGVAGGALLLCNAHRSVFSALLPELAAHLQLRPSQMGEVQAAMLAAYLAGQLPAGALADRFGGLRVLLFGLALWSAATALTALATAGGGLPAVYASRLLLGAASACAMPCVSAAAAAWVPAAARAGAVSSVYALFNVGGVLGLALAPQLAQSSGMAATFVAAGALGVVWAAVAGAYLAAARAPQQQAGSPGGGGSSSGGGGGGGSGAGPEKQSAHLPRNGQLPDADGGGFELLGMRLSARGLQQVAVLCAAHAAIGFGFFLMQNWMPAYLASLGQQLSSAGALSALPWLAAALVGVVSGRAADRRVRPPPALAPHLIRRGVPTLRVRRGFQAASFLGCAASVLPLALAGAPSVALAVGCLTANLAFYSFSFGGFHAHLQDVAGPSAGVLQGLTNSCSILTGMLASLATGWLVEATGSYSSVWLALAALYAAGAALWATCTTGEQLQAA
ncbi:hypothetical protein Rsub_00254 [Raphidocelis subcapitata]|uniref:Major facilitator superfamily (MFS) profile domain-containing protein n=1 Tax=Raphidocelis subcapitata TaxID=307507 RepID=A0A2V0NPV6_9CHLO|nr:hypothetical protein Rsub_00254 [Raphidocelis subcapitata]|eukprot:GBF87543.1 hypothetical protein Rsub_00254 [Raphidocelis subcapitata]